MEDVESPYVLLNWLQSGAEEMQLSALEQLCLALLQYDSNEALVKVYPPSTYIPILACLCQDFDISFVLLEAIIRTITYYMQALPHEVINRLVNTKGSLIAICMRLENPNMNNPIESDLTQQIIKLLEELCKRDTKSLANIGGTSYIISFMTKTYQIIHLDTIKSGFYILYKIIDKIDPTDNRLADWFEFLSNFFNHTDYKIVEYSLHCLLSIVKTCNEKKISTDHLGIERIIDDLLEMTMKQLKMDNQVNPNQSTAEIPVQSFHNKVGLSRVVIDLILCIIKGSIQFLCNLLIKSKLVDIILEIIWQYDSSSISIMQLIEGMFDQISQKSNYKSNENIPSAKSLPIMGLKVIHNRMFSEEMIQQYSRYHDCLLKAITNGNLDHLKELLLSTDFDPSYKDSHGQTSLNWASAMGFIDAANLLYLRGVDINLGERATSLHYSAAHGHVNIIESLAKNQTVDFNIKDFEGFTVIERLKQFMELNPTSKKQTEINELLAKIDTQRTNVKEEIILAKQYFIKRMVPVLISIYFKNHRATIRYHVLELLGKIFQSFENKDHKTLISEIYDENPIPYHLSKLIYRVLLQDTGENVLEAIKLSLHLTNDKHHSGKYLKWFARMGVTDILPIALLRLTKSDETKTLPLVNDCKIIPLVYSEEFAENRNLSKLQNYTLNLHQPYYWGDWNIFTTDDGLNLYNEYCYILISTEESVKTLQIFILTRKGNGIESKDHPKIYKKNQLFDNLAKTGNWKTITEDQISNHDSPNDRETSNEREPLSEYVAVEINDKNLNYRADNIQSLLDKYSVILLSTRPVSLPIQFPTLPLGKVLTFKNLVISSFTNQLKISYESGKVTPSNIDFNNTNNEDIMERSFIEISINSVAGLTVKSQNLIVYKSGPLNKQAGMKRLELSHAATENFNYSKNKSQPKNPLKDSIIIRICTKAELLSKSLENVSKSNEKFEKTVSKLLNCLENTNIPHHDIKTYFKTLNKILSSEDTQPTPYELYKSKFITVLELLFKRCNSDFLEDIMVLNINNLPKLTKMIIQLMEQIENLPSFYQLHSYISEHYLTRSMHMNAVLKNCNDHGRFDFDPIPDLSRYNFLVTPLSSPAYLNRRLNNLLQKLPWYRGEKKSFNSFRQLLSHPYHVPIPFNLEYHEKGFFNWLATNGFHTDVIMNPLKLDLISVSVSENSSNLLTSFYTIFVTNSEKEKSIYNKNYVSIRGHNSFLTIQLKHPLGLIPTHYKLGCPVTTDVNLLTLANWKLMASIDGIEWDTLSVHENDNSIRQSGVGWHVWTLDIESSLLDKVKDHGWTMFKIQQISQTTSSENRVKINKQENICNNLHTSTSLYVSGGFWINSIEFYGTVLRVSDEKEQEIKDSINDYISKFKVRSLVKPGVDWSFENKESYRIGRTLTSIKNGTVLVEWNRNTEKCHIRHKMGSQGKYEIALASDELMEETNEKEEIFINTVTESIIESRSSNDIHQESREDFRNSYQDSISWIVDPNISMPLRTSSLSSQRNSRFPSISNKENTRNFKTFQESLEDRDYNIMIQSETDDFDLREENSDFENIHADNSLQKSQVLPIKKEMSSFTDFKECSSSNKPIIQMNDKIANKLESKNKNYSKSIEESKKSFSLTKQTKRKNYHIVNMLTESKKDASRKDIVKFNTLTEDIEMSDESEDYEMIQCPDQFMNQTKPLVDNNDMDETRPVMRRKPYNSFVKNNKFKPNISGICESNMKFKPINIDETFPGIVQAIDHRSISNVIQIRSNVENLNYRSMTNNLASSSRTPVDYDNIDNFVQQPKVAKTSRLIKDIKDRLQEPQITNLSGQELPKKEETVKNKHFGYDMNQLCIKLEIQKLLPINGPLYYQKSHEFEAFMENPDDRNFNIYGRDCKSNKKPIYEFFLNPQSSLPIINYILKMIPSPDPILNIYPIDNVSEVWHSKFTIYYGFCDRNRPGSNCKNCFYNKTDKTVEINTAALEDNNEIEMILSVLNSLKCMQSKLLEASNDQMIKLNSTVNTWNDSCFLSHLLGKKIMAQLEDIWSLVSRDTLPRWIIEWPQKYPFIFFYDVRIEILKAYWFGVSRSIIWLQQRAKPNNDFIRPSFREDIVAPFHILGRLKKHIAQVPRPYYFGNTIMTETESRSVFWSAVKDLLLFHARSKEELEIQFDQEEGTGLGPTLEFINILSKEFLRPETLMWVHIDAFVDETNDFVHSENGLFPYPWPADKITAELLEKFRLLGIFIAKCLQDNRRIDMPFSETFLKLLYKDLPNYEVKEYLKEFTMVYPERGVFLKVVETFCEKKQKMLNSISGGRVRTLWKYHDQLKSLAVDIFGTTFDTLCFDMEFLPTSKVFGGESYPLSDKYSWEEDYDSRDDICNMGTDTDSILEPVTEYNTENYLQRTLMFAMNKGIKQQITKLREGFNEVFPIQSLSMFSPSELKQLLCGEQYIKWTIVDLHKFTEPTQGYTTASTNYKHFLEVLLEMTQSERKMFVQFVTGCSSLPPGGLKNLKPRLTVVKKNIKDGGPYPSVNTCMHYLKLPEYETKSELKSKLLEACKQIGFYLN